MALPVNIPFVNDLAIGATNVNVLAGIPQRVLNEASVINVALTREGVDVTYGLQIGSIIAIPSGSPCQINTTVGSLPRFDEDGVGTFAGGPGDEIAIFATNANAAAQEIRGQVRITAAEDVSIIAQPTS